MSAKHIHRKLRFHKYLFYLFFCIIGIMILSLLLGILHGLDEKNQTLLLVLILIDLLLVASTIVLIHKINYLFPSYYLKSLTRNSHTTIAYDRNTGLSENISLGCLAITQIEAL